ncbi:hypothetical protein [Occallatibacter savannae]|uniref:hypothetical protein n=1 Tax=Occallatibacter savannae TaxID=1002691 RepID=UPI0013A58D7D|nr:hypothetical protein [Occallatibacter savannae]
MSQIGVQPVQMCAQAVNCFGGRWYNNGVQACVVARRTHADPTERRILEASFRET